ncbi:hypothetical protein K3495_g5052 [Podosphaera aphanis]|nr:hypothetical protein K3495_g5052 [Podosphaera aphanis]
MAQKDVHCRGAGGCLFLKENLWWHANKPSEGQPIGPPAVQKSNMSDKRSRLARFHVDDDYDDEHNSKLLFQTIARSKRPGDHAPIKLPPRRYSPVQLQSIREFCNTHEGSLIRKSKSPWASPLLLTPKKTVVNTGKIVWRICVDYRQLNKVTKKHTHPLPYAYDEIQGAAGHKHYAFLDLENGF